MHNWLQENLGLPFATLKERELIIARGHPVFRELDAVFHQYLELVTCNSAWDDGRIEDEMLRRGTAPNLAEECVVFGPMAWGRDVVEQLGVKCSPLIRVRSMIDASEYDIPLADEIVFAWARAMIPLYRIPERSDIFNLVAFRSAELNAVSNALHGGVPEAELRDCTLQPAIVHLRRTLSPSNQATSQE